MSQKILKGDSVIVIIGQYKGKIGNVMSFSKDKKKAVVSGVNARKRSVKLKPEENIDVGFKDVNLPISISNIAIYNEEEGKKDKVCFDIQNEKKVRCYKSSSKEIIIK